jgi:hypothetical protein
MKKINLICSVFVALLFLSSCSSSKEARTYAREINGKWQLQTVVTEGIAIASQTKALLLNEADLKCFVGTVWTFNNKTHLGTYTITQNSGECASVKRYVRWSVYEAEGQPKLLQFKKVDDKYYKDIDEGNSGYRFTILQIDNTTMKLKSDVTFEGKEVSFIYNFIRN